MSQEGSPAQKKKGFSWLFRMPFMLSIKSQKGGGSDLDPGERSFQGKRHISALKERAKLTQALTEKGVG